ncbi:MAG: gephyrin-like molybdotransferase Glp [Caldilineaceae bacterium]
MTESSYPLLPVAHALEIVLAQALPLAPVQTELQATLGLVLAESVAAVDPLPPFPASIKDGYAVIAADGPGTYPVLGDITAGRVVDFVVKPGSVAYITTGAPMPAGADAVVMVEETETLTSPHGERSVHIRSSVRSGQDVRPTGFDIGAGEQVLEAGARLGAAEIGLLATVGVTQVKVYRKPVVAVLSTGDELAQPDQPLQPGQIRDSNRAMLCAAIHAAGGEALDLGIARDTQDEIAAKVEDGLRRADMLITSGGVSMGNLDYIKPILEERGTVHFGRLLMKPGKPCTFATVDVESQRRLAFGLPGNPVSSLVTFYLIAAPAIRKLAGRVNPHWPRIQAHLGQPLALDSSRPEYHRVTLRWDETLNQGAGGWLAISTGNQASSRLLSMRSANALLELPQGDGSLARGAVVSALLLSDV